MTAGTSAGAGRRYLLTAVVSHHSKQPEWDRPELQEDPSRKVELFCNDVGYAHV